MLIEIEIEIEMQFNLEFVSYVCTFSLNAVKIQWIQAIW